MLAKKEIKNLKRSAHHLKPELNVGKEGFTKSFIESLGQAFNTKELLKIKILDNCSEDIDDIIQSISELEHMHVIQKIGRTLVLFKPQLGETT